MSFIRLFLSPAAPPNIRNVSLEFSDASFCGYPLILNKSRHVFVVPYKTIQDILWKPPRPERRSQLFHCSGSGNAFRFFYDGLCFAFFSMKKRFRVLKAITGWTSESKNSFRLRGCTCGTGVEAVLPRLSEYLYLYSSTE